MDSLEKIKLGDTVSNWSKNINENFADVKSAIDTAEEKLSTIETGAQVNTVDSVNGKTGAVTLVAGDVGAYTIEETQQYVAENGGKIDKIQKNGTDLEIVNKVVNIPVPVTASDVNALPDSTKYGASIDLSINSTTYVVTIQLKDQDGNNLGQSRSIDLPLESIVTSATYYNTYTYEGVTYTKVIVLVLSTTSVPTIVPVGDLVSGLQTEITSNNKLSADLVDDSSAVNKFVTASDKTTWNGKQDAITASNKLNADFVDDSSSTNKFVTASEKSTWNAKQDAIPNYLKTASVANNTLTITKEDDTQVQFSPELEVFVGTENSVIPSTLKQGGIDFELQENESILYLSNPGTYNLKINKEDTEPTEIYSGEDLVSTITTSGDQTISVTVENDTRIRIKSDGYWKTYTQSSNNITSNNKYLTRCDFSNDKYLTALNGNWATGATSLESIMLPDNLNSYNVNISGNRINLYVKDWDSWKNIEKTSSSIVSYNLYFDNNPVYTFTTPSNETEIPNYCFFNCKTLNKVNITNNITKIGNYAFSGCTNLSVIDLTDGLQEVGNYAFYNCKLNSTSVYLPQTLRKVGNYSFSGIGLTEVVGSGALTYIGNNAFSSNDLEEFQIGYDVTNIGSMILAGNPNLQRLYVYASSSENKANTVNKRWVNGITDPSSFEIHALNNLNSTTAKQAFGDYWNYINNTTEATVIFDLEPLE